MLRLADLHRDVREGNLNRPWSLSLQVVVIALVVAHVYRAAVNERVDVGVARVNLTRADERVTVPGLAVASSGVSTTFRVRVGRREGVLSLNMVRELGVSAVSGPLCWRQTRRVDVLSDKGVCVVCSYASFLRGLVPVYR